MEIVYRLLPATIPELKEKIRLAFRDLPKSMVGCLWHEKAVQENY
jgi:hypothetical protein